MLSKVGGGGGGGGGGGATAPPAPPSPTLLHFVMPWDSLTVTRWVCVVHWVQIYCNKMGMCCEVGQKYLPMDKIIQ